MTELLSDQDVATALEHLPAWSKEGDSIVRTAKLPSFPEAIAVVNRIAELAESVNHHPDIDIRWRTLTLRLSTHSAGGLTGKDTSLAAQIDDAVDAVS